MKRDGLIKVGGIRCKGWWIDVIKNIDYVYMDVIY